MPPRSTPQYPASTLQRRPLQNRVGRHSHIPLAIPPQRAPPRTSCTVICRQRHHESAGRTHICRSEGGPESAQKRYYCISCAFRYCSGNICPRAREGSKCFKRASCILPLLTGGNHAQRENDHPLAQGSSQAQKCKAGACGRRGFGWVVVNTVSTLVE